MYFAFDFTNLLSLVLLSELRGFWADARPPQVIVRGNGLRLAGSSVRRVFNGLEPSPLAELGKWSSLLQAEEAMMAAPAFHGSRHLGNAKTRIFVHHVWKCGGMNLCDMAVRNGELTPHPDFANRYAGCDLWTVQQLLAVNYSFAQWQFPLPMQVNLVKLPAEIAALTILRNPLNQALSHFKHASSVLPALWSNLSSFIDFGLCFGNANRTLSPQAAVDTCQRFLLRPLPWSSLSSDHFGLFEDNQQLRWIAPIWLDSVNTNWPQLNAKYLDAAKTRLKEFDQVLILEELHIRDRFRLAKYGWRDLDDERAANLHSNKPGTSWQPSDAAVYLKKSPAVLKRLCKVQQWDIALYEYAVGIAQRQAANEGIKMNSRKPNDVSAAALCQSL